MMAIEKLKALGYLFQATVDGRIAFSYKGLPPPSPEALALLAEVQTQRTTALAYLKIIWPPESQEAERKCRPGPPRLYPFVMKTVRTPLGYGTLWQVGTDFVRVKLVNRPKSLVEVHWSDVWPVS